MILQKKSFSFPKLYRIGEVMRYTGLSRQTLHNYTIMGLIAAADRTESGHRLYPETVFERLQKIELFKRHHTLTEVKKMLDQGSASKKRKHAVR